MKDDNFLSRWSRLKHRGTAAEAPLPAKQEPPAPAVPAVQAPAAASAAPKAEESALPPLESLDLESDFAPFMRAKVDAAIRRKALKTLFADPRFNVMDGLDVYIDDYTKSDPIPPEWLEKMTQMAHLGAYQEPAPEAQAAAGAGAVTESVAAPKGEPLPQATAEDDRDEAPEVQAAVDTPVHPSPEPTGGESPPKAG